MKSRDARVLAILGLLALPSLVHAQADGRVQGVVREAGTEQPLAGAQVFIDGTQLGVVTSGQGRFLLPSVPAGTQTLRVSLIGYSEHSEEIQVEEGAVVTVNVSLTSEAVALSEIVVTGVSGATVKAKVPFEIATLSEDDMPVPAVSAGSMIQGKVAGATVMSGSGRPGSAPTILLRGPKSINAAGRDQGPLYIVDGVILAEGLVDIDAMDIESIEVIKGAAAASLYGSRAAAGVVQISTRRGRNMPNGDVRFTARSEYGRSSLPGRFDLTQAHAFRMNDAGTAFIDAEGNECAWLECSSVVPAGQLANGATPDSWNTYQINEWPGQTYDHVERFFTDGPFNQNYIAADGRTGGLNFHVSFSNLDEQGVMPGQEGYQRNNFRLNVDQQISEVVQVSASTFYSRSKQSDTNGSLFTLTRMPAGVDLMAKDESGRVVLEPDPFNENENPLNAMLYRDYNQERGRFLGSANVRVNPVSWLDVSGNFSYDRLDRDDEDFVPKGYRTIRPNSSLNEGNLFQYNLLSESINASVQATFRYNLTDAISNRTTLQYLYEREDRQDASTGGSQFAVAEIPVMDNIDQTRLSASSGIVKVRSDGYYINTAFDIMDRYFIDVLARNDGSSLFGPNERRHWYYALRGGWRVSEESWFPAIADEFKLRYAYGTAGNRPRFSAQYETYSVGGGSVTPVNLGNRDLRPEHSVEHEAGFDAMFFGGRLEAGLTYARSNTTDQILPVPLPAYSGFGTQYQNVGTLKTNTWEASLDARLLDRGDFSWSARVLFDRTRQEITELSVPAFTYGVAGQGLEDVFYARVGEPLGRFYGVRFAHSCADLPTGMSCDGFTVNDEGLLVWVGNGSLSDNLWGTDADVTVRGVAPKWGTPFQGECTNPDGDRTTFCPVGNSMPDYSVSLSNTFAWKGLSVYGLLEAVQGFDVYNQPLQWATFQSYSGIMDQRDVPEAQRKPIGYHAALYGVSGLLPSSVFVEDASFVKLREVAVRYRIDGNTFENVPGLGIFDALTLSAVGRNLKTWSDYRGYDPETGSGGGDVGSAAIARVDGYQYPNFRTWTLGVELTF